MTQLPGTNYMSDSARTEAEMKVALDKVNEVIAEIGSKEVFVSTLATGVLATPLSSMVSVASEGGASTPDTLLSIGVSNITQGRIVILKNENAGSTATTGAYITITHGTGAEAVEMLDGENFILCSRRQLALVYTGNHWVEVWRTYGRNNADEKLAERTDIGLGDASVETIATGSVGDANSKVLKVGATANIPTDGLLAIDSSGNIKAGTVTGGNADTLDTLDSLAFVRSNAGTAQSINESLTLTSAGDTTLVINDTGGTNSPGVAFNQGPDERASIFYNSADGSSEWITKDVSGTTTESVRLDPATNKFEFSVDGATWQSLTPGAGNGLNADQLDGNEWADIPDYAAGSHRVVYHPVADPSLSSPNAGSVQANLSNSPNGSIITQLSNLDYPVPPNGSRRFLIHVSLHVLTQFQDTNRTANFKVMSGSSGGSTIGEAIYTSSNRTVVPAGFYYKTAYNIAVIPSAGHQVTIRMGEGSGDNQLDFMPDFFSAIDFRHGDRYTLATPVGNGRCYVDIEYLPHVMTSP